MLLVRSDDYVDERRDTIKYSQEELVGRVEELRRKGGEKAWGG